MENISNDYIEKAIIELVALFGIKENIEYDPLFDLLKKRDISGCIQKIAGHLGLPVKIVLTYVSESDVNAVRREGSAIPMGNGEEERFESSDLVKTDAKNLGVQGIAAQVLVPQDIPFYGSARLDNFPIKVRVSRNCVDYPETLISTMAHELSHILLATVGSKEAHNEIYTDLTPMVLGFSDVAHDGRKVVRVTRDQNFMTTTTTTHTTSYGYLNDSQFDFAYSEIEKILKKNILLKNKLSKEIDRFEKKNTAYLKYLKLLKNIIAQIRSRNIKNSSLSPYLDLAFFNEANALSQKNSERLEKLKKYYSGPIHYTKRSLDILNKNIQNTLRFTNDLKDKINQTKKDTKTLIKYLDPINKIKMNASYLNIRIKE